MHLDEKFKCLACIVDICIIGLVTYGNKDKGSAYKNEMLLKVHEKQSLLALGCILNDLR